MNAGKDDFHGVWRLADWSVQLGGDSWRPYGGRVDGYISYHPAGWMSATLMERDRPAISQDRAARIHLTKAVMCSH